MLPGDVVIFNLAVDRRNGDQRATNVYLHRLMEEQKDHTGREQVLGSCVCTCVCGGRRRRRRSACSQNYTLID
jgi:hypothetical protein